MTDIQHHPDWVVSESGDGSLGFSIDIDSDTDCFLWQLKEGQWILWKHTFMNSIALNDLAARTLVRCSKVDVIRWLEQRGK